MCEAPKACLAGMCAIAPADEIMDAEPSIALMAEQRARWGEAVDPGLAIVPALLLRHQQRLGLTPLDLVLIINLVAEWDELGELPTPRLSVLADRIGATQRTVQRLVVKLARAGLVERRPGETCRGRTVRRFDLSGLQRRLQELSRQEPRACARRAVA